MQAIGNVLIDVKDMKIDALSMSGHKLYGPKGIGVLYVRNGIDFQKLQNGGHQEKNKRAGTENIAGIVGMGKAIEIAYSNFNKNTKHMKELSNYFLKELENKIPNIKLNGDKTNRLPGNCNISFENINGEELLFKLDEKGICASAGSACSTGTTEPSHVLTAIGLPPKFLNGTIRFTFGIDNTKDDIDYLVNELQNIVANLRNK